MRSRSESTRDSAITRKTPAVLSLGKLCEEHGHHYEWASGQKPRLTKQGKNILCKTENFVPLVVPGLSSNSGTSSCSTSPPQDSSSTSSSPAGAIHQTSKTTIKRGMTNEHREPACETSWSGWRSSQIILKIQKCLHPHTFLVTQTQNFLRKWHPGSTRCTYIHSRLQSLSADQVLYLFPALRVNGSIKRSKAYDTKSNYFIMVAW